MRRDGVGASSISLISAQARKTARSAALPFPTKFYFVGALRSTVSIVTVVTMFPGAAVVSKTPSPSSQPSRTPKRIFVPTAQSADCTVDRRRKYHGFPLSADGGLFRKAEPLAVPYLLMWVPHANTAEASAEAANLPSARRQPTALCSRYG